MRTRKLVLLVLLAVGATFLLSSCDALLDAIYANNTINVTVIRLVRTISRATNPTIRT